MVNTEQNNIDNRSEINNNQNEGEQTKNYSNSSISSDLNDNNSNADIINANNAQNHFNSIQNQEKQNIARNDNLNHDKATSTFEEKTDNVNNENNTLGNNIQTDNNVTKNKKEREFKINSGNMAIIASSISLLLSVINKLLRMLVLVSGGIIIFVYIVCSLLSFFALYSCIKNAIKNSAITVDSFFCGVSLLVLILI